MKTFKQISEMSMSVTLKPKKNNMYKVTGVGKKMAAHGGIKKGEKFHDRDIDGMHDSGIKVKYEKPKMKKEEMMPGEGKAYVKGKKLRMQRTMDKHGVKQQMPPIKAKLGKFKKVGESIQRRMDRLTIIATDPATGRKVVKVAPKKQIDIGKGKNESVVNEISDKMKMAYIKKANKKISDTEHMRDYQNKQMDKKPGSFSKSDKEFVNKMYDKDTEKRRKGVRMAKGKLGESFADEVNAMQDALNEISTATLASYQKKAGAQYSQAKRDSDERTAYKPYSVKGGRASDAAEKLKNKRGKGLSQSKKILDKRYSDKQVKMGKGIAFDKRYKGGNMTGASKAIDKIKKGLSDHPKVSNALKRANEEFNKGE